LFDIHVRHILVRPSSEWRSTLPRLQWIRWWWWNKIWIKSLAARLAYSNRSLLYVVGIFSAQQSNCVARIELKTCIKLLKLLE